jgi:hypothetical protein
MWTSTSTPHHPSCRLCGRAYRLNQSAVQGSVGVSGLGVLAKIKIRSREPGVHQHQSGASMCASVILVGCLKIHHAGL